MFRFKLKKFQSAGISRTYFSAISFRKRSFSISTNVKGLKEEETSKTKLQGALNDVKVLDLSRILAGPFCSMLLADMGATVYKIEHPERGDDTRSWTPPEKEGSLFIHLPIY